MSIHHGHRKRLKERFAREGLESFHEINMLELLLFYCIPQKDTNPLAHALLDRFGNLCLVQRNVNSKISNLNPVAKKLTFQEMIAGGSLKLREMARLTDGVDSWKGGVCQRHEEEMVALLREACGLDVLEEAD